jgi:hypothetical protein
MEKKHSYVVPALLIIIIILAGFVVYLSGCGGKTTGDRPGRGEIAGQSSFCSDTSALGYTTGERLPGMIDFKTAQELSLAYVNDNGKNVVWHKGAPTKMQDARCIWFDLKKLKSFIGYIENAACRSACPDSLELGIRIYYAKYPDEEGMRRLTDLFGVPKEYALHHTVFMVPTYRDPGKKANIDFDPQMIGKGCRLMPLDPIKSLFWLGYDPSLNGPADAQNHGSLKPPPDDSGLFPETGQ